MSNFMNYHLPHCVHCQDTLLSAPEKEDGYWFMRCLSCGARNILSQPPLPLFVPEPESTDALFIGYIDAQA
jgi:hypothetical protein